MGGKYGVVSEKGINDMPSGWTRENEWNYKVYCRWHSILRRIYDEKIQNKYPTYIKVTICLEWHWLSNFVKDIVLIEGYDEEKFLKGEIDLDKDIKSNNENKEYSFNNCLFVSKKENIGYSNKTSGNKNNKGKVAQYDKQGNLIRVWDYAKKAKEQLNINHIEECCNFHEINCNKEKWYKEHKNKPRYTAGNYIWKYYKE